MCCPLLMYLFIGIILYFLAQSWSLDFLLFLGMSRSLVIYISIYLSMYLCIYPPIYLYMLEEGGVTSHQIIEGRWESFESSEPSSWRTALNKIEGVLVD